MTILADKSKVTMVCDKCSIQLSGSALAQVMLEAVLRRWFVFNDPNAGVSHYCNVCGVSVEFATQMRNHITRVGGFVPQEDSDDGDASVILDDLVAVAVERRAQRQPPALPPTKKFSLSFDEDE